MKRTVCMLMAIVLAIAAMSISVCAAGQNPANSGIETQSSDDPGGTNGGGTLLFQMTASNLSSGSLLPSGGSKYFTGSSLTKQYVQYTGTVTHTYGLSVRCGICYYSDNDGKYLPIEASIEYFESGVYTIGPKVSKSYFVPYTSKKYYGFIKNDTSTGKVSGTLKFYEIN